MDDPINAADSLRFIETCGDGDFISNQQPAQPLLVLPRMACRPAHGSNIPKITLENVLLIDSQRPSCLVVHAPVGRHMEIIPLLKRSDRFPCVWSHHTINRSGIYTVILQSLLYLLYSIRIGSSGIGGGSSRGTILNPVRYRLSPSRCYRKAGSCQQCRYNGYR